HRAIALVVLSRIWAVDRNERVVRAQAMPLRIRVRKEPSLKKLVRRGLHTRNEVGRAESGLLDFCKEILRISIEHKTSDRNEWVVLESPHFRHIERIVTVGVSVLLRHDLYERVPHGSLTALDVLEQIARGVVWIADRGCFLRCEVCNPGFRAK